MNSEMCKKIEERIQSINHVTDWALMHIELAESVLVNLKKKVSMNVFTLENLKTAKGMVREPLLGRRGKVQKGYWENSKLVA